MANTTISPNMGLPVPVVGVDPGDDWAKNVNSCLSVIDGHSHVAGSGVPITPLAININSDLSFSQNNATNLRSARFSPQSNALNAGTDLGCLYELGVDLFYIDGAGNNIRMTQSGSVTGSSGTITGLPSGTASASFAASAFTFQSATNTPAAINVGSVTIAQTVASGKSVTVSANGAQASNYSLVLPLALPTVQSTLISDTSGNLSFTGFSSGTYTPTITPGSGSGQAALGPFFYTRIGNNVTVSGTVTGTTSGASLCSMAASLPINPTTTFTNAYDLTGVVGIPSNNASNVIYASPGTYTANILTGTLATGQTNICTITFTYSCA